MKNYQYWSTETLKHRRDALAEDIAQWEKLLVNARSFLYRVSLTHYIKKSIEEIRAIDAEICYREHND